MSYVGRYAGGGSGQAAAYAPVITSFVPAGDVTNGTVTYANVDGTNALWTFTASTTKQLLSASVYAAATASSHCRVALGLSGSQVASTEVALCTGTNRVRALASWLVTGLTPGTSYTYSLMLASSSAGQTVTIYGGGGSTVVMRSEPVQ